MQVGNASLEFKQSNGQAATARHAIVRLFNQKGNKPPKTSKKAALPAMVAPFGEVLANFDFQFTAAAKKLQAGKVGQEKHIGDFTLIKNVKEGTVSTGFAVITPEQASAGSVARVSMRSTGLGAVLVL